MCARSERAFRTEEKAMRKFALIAAALVAGFVSMACNTVQGVGKDIERGGEAIQRAVK